jgi:hypothetical protein
MYLRGRVTIDLTDTRIALSPPRNFFGGVANLLTGGNWQTREEMETYKLLSFAQSANRALMDVGVRDVVRVSIAREPVYEDLGNNPDDFEAAMQALQAKLAQGYEPDPHSEFDLVLKHDDGVLRYVIDLDFVREHRIGAHPVAITVTGVPTELRRRDEEDQASYQERISVYFRDQVAFDAAQARWEAQFRGFLEQLGDHFRTTLGIRDVQIETRTVLPRRRSPEALYDYASFGYPLYGYDPTIDLAYLLLWDALWQQNALRMHNFYYGDYGAPYVFIDDGGWGYDDASRYDVTVPVLVGSSDSGGGGWMGGADFSSDSGGGGGIGAGVSSDSGGGGWLSSIGDLFSDSGGGGSTGDSGSSDSGGGGSTCSSGSSCSSSSCSSCGGGGCSSS